MTKTAAAVAVDPLVSLERKTPEIDPNLVVLESAGFVTRSFFARLPHGFVADDLKEPTAWKKVQQSGKAMKMHDRVYVVAYDQTWVAEAIVASADHHGITFAKPRITAMPERYDRLFQDDKYKVAWCGSGYVVERKSDGHVMTQATANPELATRLLVQLYPQRV